MSDDDAQPAASAQLVELLRQLIELLDNPATDGVAIDRTSERLSRMLDELRVGEDDLEELDPQMRNQLHGALEHAMRLNAVARQLVGKRLAVIDAQLQLARTARRALEPADDDDSGEWCDVAG